MQLSTKVDFSWQIDKLQYHQNYFFMGSCFSENIGKLLLHLKFNVCQNPFGILYNPESIAFALDRIIDKQLFSESELIFDGNLWHSLAHHGSFSHTNKKTCLQQINNSLENAHADLKNTKILFISFGSSEVFEYLEDGFIAGNCHKLDAKLFKNRFLSIEEICNRYQFVIKKLLHFNPQLKICLSVSPVRYKKNGLSENATNKARLLLALQQICRQFEACFYLPTFEFFVDELRDYRFYQTDLIHPNETAIQLLWERLKPLWFDEQTQVKMKKLEKVINTSRHKPIHRNEKYYEQMKKLQEEMLLLEKEVNVSLQNELHDIDLILKNKMR